MPIPSEFPNPPQKPAAGSAPSSSLALENALARCFLSRYLAKAFEYPTSENWAWLREPPTLQAFQCSAQAIAALAQSDEFLNAATRWIQSLEAAQFPDWQSGYISLFGHSARGSVPLNEIEYGDLKADPLFQPHRLADLAAFYRAFGLEVSGDAAERPDHVSVELEFLSVLAAKEAFAIEQQHLEEQQFLVLSAQRQFVREHMGRWMPAFARRLMRAAGGGSLGAMAALLNEFVLVECRRLGLAAGSEDLLLRPMDELGESVCASCGLPGRPPGAE